MFRISLARLALGLIAAVVPVAASASVITLTGSNNVQADVSNFEGSQTKSDAPVAIPYANTVTATLEGDSSAVTASLTNSAFTFTFNQVADFSKVSGQSQIFFTVSADTQYTIGGSFGADGGAFGLELSAGLFDTANPESALYNSRQTGSYQGAQTFTLGGSAGNDVNVLTGSSTGTLVAGKTYEFTVFTGFEAPTDPTGTGTVNIAFSNPTGGPGPGPSAPLPPAIWLGLAFLAALMVWKKLPLHRIA